MNEVKQKIIDRIGMLAKLEDEHGGANTRSFEIAKDFLEAQHISTSFLTTLDENGFAEGGKAQVHPSCSGLRKHQAHDSVASRIDHAGSQGNGGSKGMKHFAVKRAPKAPAEFSIVLETLDKSKVNIYRDLCYKGLGKPIAPGQPGNWYESKGYFFFRSRGLAAQFMVSVNGSVANNHQPFPQGDATTNVTSYNRCSTDDRTVSGLSVHALQAKLSAAYTT